MRPIQVGSMPCRSKLSDKSGMVSPKVNPATVALPITAPSDRRRWLGLKVSEGEALKGGSRSA